MDNERDDYDPVGEAESILKEAGQNGEKYYEVNLPFKTALKLASHLYSRQKVTEWSFEKGETGQEFGLSFQESITSILLSKLPKIDPEDNHLVLMTRRSLRAKEKFSISLSSREVEALGHILLKDNAQSHEYGFYKIGSTRRMEIMTMRAFLRLAKGFKDAGGEVDEKLCQAFKGKG